MPRILLEVAPKKIILPIERCGSCSVIMSSLLAMGQSMSVSYSQVLHNLIWTPTSVNWGFIADSFPKDATYHFVVRDPMRRFQSARGLLGQYNASFPTDPEQLLEVSRYTTDPHLVPVSRIVREKMKEFNVSFLKIEEFEIWAPEFGMTVERVNESCGIRVEPIPEHLFPLFYEIYGDDYKMGGYNR